MKKRFLSLVLTVAVMFTAIPQVAVTVAGFELEPIPAGSTAISNRMELATLIAIDPVGTFHLANDIDLDGQPWLPITGFNGTFDGRGHVIYNMLITGTHTNAGLFGEVGEVGVIKNVGVVGSINMDSIGIERVGGIVAQGGTITNCFSNVDIIVAGGRLTGRWLDRSCYGSVGGISGSGSVVNMSYNLGNIDATYIFDVGGIIGSGGFVTDSFNRGNISVSNQHGVGSSGGIVGRFEYAGYEEQPRVVRTFNVGNVSGLGFVGGVAGWVGFGSVANSFWNIDSDQSVNGTPRPNVNKVGVDSTVANGTVTALLSLTTAQMRERSSFAGWDFDNVWTFADGQNDGMPVLQSASIFPPIITRCDGECDWGEWAVTTERSCTVVGVQRRECNNCLEFQREAIPAGCNMTDNGGTPATCRNAGELRQWCNVCSNETSEPIPQLAHVWSEWEVMGNVRVRYCTFSCGESQEIPLDAPIPNDPVPEVCEESNTGRHEWGSWRVTTAPTCDEHGNRARSCLLCDMTENQAIIATGHDWSGWTVSREPTHEVEGVRVRLCSECDATDEESIPKLPPPENPRRLGDVNGDDNLTVQDALLILRYLVRLEVLVDDAFDAARITGGELPTVQDALAILRWLVRLPSPQLDPIWADKR
jgi:hypothetical protein